MCCCCNGLHFKGGYKGMRVDSWFNHKRFSKLTPCISSISCVGGHHLVVSTSANTKINKKNKTKTFSVWYLLFPPLSPQSRVKMRTPQRLGFNPLIGANEQKLSRLENQPVDFIRWKACPSLCTVPQPRGWNSVQSSPEWQGRFGLLLLISHKSCLPYQLSTR